MMASKTNRARAKKKSSLSQIAVQGLFFLFVLVLLVAAVRITYMQTVQAAELTNLAEQQRLRQIETPAPRGTIYDREGEVLATSVQVYNIIADPTKITRPKQAAEMVAVALGGLAETFEPTLKKQGKKRYSPVAKKVDPEAVDRLKAAIDKLPYESKQDQAFKQGMRSMSYRLDYRRTYPAGSVGGQTVGFCNFENVGGAGIELKYEAILSGEPGVSFSERDVKGNPIPSGVQRSIESKPGSDIVLTMDKDIQFFAEQEVAAAVERHKGISGSFIVMNPKTGEIYAGGSVPNFDPNFFNTADPENMKNRAFVDVFEPGSTLKCLTVAGALDKGAVTPTTSFKVPWKIQVGTRTIKDSHEHPTTQMTVSEIIEQSSNVGTTRIAQKMGKTDLYDTFVAFGLAEPPGLDFPGSLRGRLAKPSEWADVSLSNISFGQGVSMTPIQLSRAVSAIANKGIMTTPHLLKDIPSNPTLVEKRIGTEVISSKAASDTVDILRRVMTEGTGKTIKVKDYDIAGKTGTAQKAIPGVGYGGGKYIGSFIGFLPADDPELLVLVIIDEPKEGYYGGTVAGGAFSRIAAFAASHLDIAPSNVHKFQVTETGTNTTKKP